MVGTVVSHKAHTCLKGQPLFSFSYVLPCRNIGLPLPDHFFFKGSQKFPQTLPLIKLLPVNSILKHSSGQLKSFCRWYLP